MKLLFLSGVLVIGVFALLVPLSSFAQDKKQSVILPKGQVINHDYFATGSSVDIEGTVNGDVYTAGGNVLINGTINGDVLSAGGQITVRGTARNVRVAGGQIVIDGKVSGNTTAVGGNITTTSASSVGGSLVGAGGQFNLLGPIGKTVSLAAGQVSIGNDVGGDVWISGQTITLTPEAKVNGSLSYVSSQQAVIDNGASVSGKIHQTYPPQRRKAAGAHVFAALAELKIAASIISFLVSLIVGLLLLAFLPLYSDRVIEHISHHPWQSLLIGIIAWIITPIFIFFLLITLVGIPFAVLVGIAVAVFSYVGEIIVSVVIGAWVVEKFNKRKNMFVALLIGLIIVGIIGFIPIIGWLFSVAVSAIGFGSVIYMEKIYYSELRAKKLI